MPAAATPNEYLPRFRQMAKEAGRDPGALPVTLGGAPDDPEQLKRYRDLGVTTVNTSLPSAKTDEILPLLDRWASVVRQV